jgi:hypothetical protein
VNDYVLRISVSLVDENGAANKHATFCRWERYPACPQIGWILWDGRPVIGMEMRTGLFAAFADVDGFRVKTEEAFEYWCRTLALDNGFVREHEFRDNSPPR